MKHLAIFFAAALVVGCGGAEQLESNPFLEGWEAGNDKEDTGYVNLRYTEMEVTLEGDLEAPSYRIFEAPGELAQFAVTYLREKRGLYLEILAEDAGVPARVEWLVDGVWLDHTQARAVSAAKLTHFRLANANAVVKTGSNVQAGQVFEARVPKKPYSIMSDAGDKCATPDDHIGLSQSVYWYLWNPDRSGCPAELTTTLKLTVEEVFPANAESYPEYDKLWADGKLTAAVFWAKLDDGDVAKDYNWDNFNKFCTFLTQAGFSETTAELGKRFTKVSGERTVIVDVFGPDVFHSVADYTNLQNWQKAVLEHEIVMYNGHSVLGTGMAFEQIRYPDSYQIFQVASCLSYEYYVNPVLAGKGSWDKVDVLSNVEPTYYSENLPLTSAVLAKLIWGFENGGRASWQDIMQAASQKLGHARFGVSGARGNCYSPAGDRCHSEPPAGEKRFTQEPAAAIPDNNPAGISSTIEVGEDLTISDLSLELDVSHTWVGDLKIELSHDGVSQTIWNREGGSAKDIRQVIRVPGFVGQPARGAWTLKVIDAASRDTGTLNRWTLVVSSGGGEPPVGEPKTYASGAALDIPDGDERGVSSVIEVPDALSIASLKVELDISHSYVGDLTVVVSHDGTPFALWDQAGGSADDIRQSFEVSVFNGQSAAGTWTLQVVDHAAIDTGRLNRWALIVTPAR